MPEVVVEIHLDQHVAREEHPLNGVLLAVADLSDRLGRDHDAADLVLQPERLHTTLQRLAHLALKAGVGVDDVPLEVFIRRRRELRGGNLLTTVVAAACRVQFF